AVYPVACVGCSPEKLSLLENIHADQQRAAAAGQLNQAGEEPAGRFRFEVGTARSLKINHASRGKATRQRQLEWLEIIGADWQDLQTREHFSKPGGGFLQLFLRKIDRNVN